MIWVNTFQVAMMKNKTATLIECLRYPGTYGAYYRGKPIIAEAFNPGLSIHMGLHDWQLTLSNHGYNKIKLEPADAS